MRGPRSISLVEAEVPYQQAARCTITTFRDVSISDSGQNKVGLRYADSIQASKLRKGGSEDLVDRVSVQAAFAEMGIPPATQMKKHGPY